MVANGTFASSSSICTMIMDGLKIFPMVLTSTTFRTFSVVIIASFLRWYSLCPILLMLIVQVIMVKKLIRRNSYTREFVASFAPYGIMALISGTILSPTVNDGEDETRLLNQKRKAWRLFDSISTFVVYAIALSIIMILWETTTALNKNLSLCAFNVVKNNVIITVPWHDSCTITHRLSTMSFATKCVCVCVKGE